MIPLYYKYNYTVYFIIHGTQITYSPNSLQKSQLSSSSFSSASELGLVSPLRLNGTTANHFIAIQPGASIRHFSPKFTTAGSAFETPPSRYVYSAPNSYFYTCYKLSSVIIHNGLNYVFNILALLWDRWIAYPIHGRRFA